MGEWRINPQTGVLVERKSGGWIVRDAPSGSSFKLLRRIPAHMVEDWECVGYADYRYYHHDPNWKLWRCEVCGIWHCAWSRYGSPKVPSPRKCVGCLSPEEMAQMERKKREREAKKLAAFVRRGVFWELLRDAVGFFLKACGDRGVKIEVGEHWGYFRLKGLGVNVRVHPSYSPRVITYREGTLLDGVALCAHIADAVEDTRYSGFHVFRFGEAWVGKLIPYASQIPRPPKLHEVYRPTLPRSVGDELRAKLEPYADIPAVSRLARFIEKRTKEE